MISYDNIGEAALVHGLYHGTPRLGLNTPAGPALDHLLELADAAQRHPSSLDVTELVALGRGTEQLESDLARVTAERNTARSERDAALDRIDALEERLEESIEDASVARAEATILRRQLGETRIEASFERLTLTVTGCARLTAAVQADSARLVDWMSERDAARRIAPPMPVFDLSDVDDAVVVDVP